MYLSIDLDYWFSDESPSIRGLKRILDRVKNVRNKIIIDEHHCILDHINESGSNHILHVDYHQDIVYPTLKKENITLECGSFFYFVKDKEKKNFEWFYPSYVSCVKMGLGLCMDPSYKPMTKPCFIFKDQKGKMGLPSDKQLENVSHVGIAFSFDYLKVYDVKVFIEVVDALIEMFGFNMINNLFNDYKYMDDWKEGQEVLKYLEEKRYETISDYSENSLHYSYSG